MAYPLDTGQPFPKNRWYVAGFARDLGNEPVQQLILDTPVALYRTSEGKAVAMYGLCPHRYYPLGEGRVEGDALVCGYHGFAFDCTGKCVRIPSQGTGAGFSQPVYPLVEKGSLLWIWMGDRQLADPELITPYEDFGLDQPGWAVSGHDYFEVQGRAQLLVDNLMDLTHLPHVHHHVPGGDVFLKTKSTQRERARSFRVEQQFQSVWTPFFSFLWGEGKRFDGEKTFLNITDFYGPEFIRTSGPLMQSSPDEDSVASKFGDLHFLHAVTPRSETSTHYYALQTRNFRTDDEDLGKELGAMDKFIREQDRDAIEQLEPWVERGSRMQNELLVKTDKSATIVRRKIRDMILAEESVAAE